MKENASDISSLPLSNPLLHNVPLRQTSWHDLHRWSISEVGEFWQTVSDFCGIKWLERGSGNAYTPPPSTHLQPPRAATAGTGESLRRRQPGDGVMTDARWFEGAKLNFAHNLMPPPTDDEVRAFLFASIYLAQLGFAVCVD